MGCFEFIILILNIVLDLGFWALDFRIERSEIRRLRLLVSIWFQILFHSPHRGAFHLSLTVLVHYRSLKVFSLGKGRASCEAHPT